MNKADIDEFVSVWADANMKVEDLARKLGMSEVAMFRKAERIRNMGIPLAQRRVLH